jgi:hypothetical protein
MTDETTGASTTTRRRARRTDTGASGPRRSRRPRPSGAELVDSLTEMVDRLLAENRDLKRALARAQQGAGTGLGQAARALSGLQRRVSRALNSEGSGRGRQRAAGSEPAPRPRRKVTDPEVLERRRAALAKARAARAAKRAAGG